MSECNTITASEDPKPEKTKKPLRGRVLAHGQIPLEHRGKFIQCDSGTRLGITLTGSVVNLDKNRPLERYLRRTYGKKEVNRLRKQPEELKHFIEKDPRATSLHRMSR
jgi:hypothetical protein